MATLNSPGARAPVSSRDWAVFAYHAFARIVARKHNLIPPDIGDGSNLSDEELDSHLQVVKELAHLPPG